MKQYLDLMKDIITNGHSHPDRTGFGRRSIFGTQLRFKMTDGFPLVTTRQISTKALIHELLWFIEGNTDNRQLNENGVKIWDKWTVTEESVEEFIEKNKSKLKDIDEETLDTIKANFREKYLGLIGPMYGFNWRHCPSGENTILDPRVKFEDIPKDKITVFKNQYDEYISSLEDTDTPPSFEEVAIELYSQSIDQLGILITNLKNKPFSARHIVTSWIPQFIPYEDLSPKENVLLNKGSLAPCHAFFQCFVNPAEEEGGKLRLSLQMYQRKQHCASV